MTNSLLWTNPSMTCLGDRLLDTMLISAYAKIMDANIYFPWLDCPFTIGQSDPKYNYKNGEQRSWDQVRFEDYKFENFIQYFTMPKNVKINETCNPNLFFGDILGGCISPKLFWEKYLSSNCSYETFLEIFKTTVNEFKPTEKLNKIVGKFKKPKVSVHLRRTDKINVAGDYSTFMTYEGLGTLDYKTKEALNIFYNEKDDFYFSSDDNEVRIKYENEYRNHIKHDVTCTDVEKTYVDLYMLSISDYIILSQVHSNFSVFASYLNNSKLVYLYDNCLIVSQKFNESENFIHYKQITI